MNCLKLILISLIGFSIGCTDNSKSNANPEGSESETILSSTSAMPTSFMLDAHIVGEPPHLAATQGSALGASIASGDRDNDGQADFIAVGRPDGGNARGGDLQGLQGTVAIYCLSPDAPPSLCLVLHPPYESAHNFGQHIVTGDFDGDGKSDLVISDPSWNPFGFKKGRLTVIYADLLNEMISNETVLDYPYPQAYVNPTEHHPVQEISIPFTSVNDNYFGNNLEVIKRDTGRDYLLVQASRYNFNGNIPSSAGYVFMFSNLPIWNQGQAVLSFDNSALQSSSVKSLTNSSDKVSSGGNFGQYMAALSPNAIAISAFADSFSEGSIFGYYVSGSNLVKSSTVSHGNGNGAQLGKGLYAVDVFCTFNELPDLLTSNGLPVDTGESFGSIGAYAERTSGLPAFQNIFFSTLFPRITFENQNQIGTPQAILEDWRASSAKLKEDEFCETTAVSVPNYDVAGQIDHGVVWLYIPTGGGFILGEFNHIKVELPIPATAGDRLGSGDIEWVDYDMDGDQDLVIGSPQYDNTRGALSFVKNVRNDSLSMVGQVTESISSYRCLGGTENCGEDNDTIYSAANDVVNVLIDKENKTQAYLKFDIDSALCQATAAYLDLHLAGLSQGNFVLSRVSSKDQSGQEWTESNLSQPNAVTPAFSIVEDVSNLNTIFTNSFDVTQALTDACQAGETTLSFAIRVTSYPYYESSVAFYNRNYSDESKRPQLRVQ